MSIGVFFPLGLYSVFLIMDYFRYRNKELYCEQIQVKTLAKLYQTPLYIYSARSIREHYHRLKNAFPQTLICYSVKANSNLSICRLLSDLKCGFDVVSAGELYRVLKIGADTSKTVFAGVGKTREEIVYALKNEILLFNTESIDEIETINQCAKALKKIACIGLRINPDVSAHTHRYITTATDETKFGVSINEAKIIIKNIHHFPAIRLVALQMHIGSQITSVLPYLKAIRKIVPLIWIARKEGHFLRYLDIGGGFGIYYKAREAKPASKFAEKVLPIIKKLGLSLIIEPGRFIVGNAGIIVTKIIRTKQIASRYFIICDAGMNTLIRPALYDAYHKIAPISIRQRVKKIRADIVGPICESADFFAINRLIQDVNKNEYLSLFSAGAYGYSMTSNYNSRTKPAEVLVDGRTHRLISRAETYKDLIRLEEHGPST
jgi:diaminopimelate decarboxylase